MGLETFNGNLADLVVTNPTGTDPKSQGDDHIRGIKKTLVDTFGATTGQIYKADGTALAKNLQIGLGSAAENHHLDGSVANQFSLKRGTPEAPGTELIKALNGVLSFPNQGTLLQREGFIELPNGVTLQWGKALTNASGIADVTYPSGKSYTISLPVVCAANSGAFIATVTGAGAIGLQFKGMASNTGSVAAGLEINWVAVTL